MVPATQADWEIVMTTRSQSHRLWSYVGEKMSFEEIAQWRSWWQVFTTMSVQVGSFLSSGVLKCDGVAVGKAKMWKTLAECRVPQSWVVVLA